MGKLKDFRIVLDNPNSAGIYFGGQTVNGRVIISLNEPIKVREVRLEFLGAAQVRWTEREQRGTGKNKRTQTVVYSSYEMYINTRTTIFNPAEQGSEYHPAGDHQYPFSFQLPENTPSSFESIYGNVRYFIKGTMDRPWRFDHNCKTMFSVLSHYDLNQLPELTNQTENTKQKTMCCLCCKSGPISGKIRLNRTGFVSGESILINAECDNKSNRTMNASYVQLKQWVQYFARGKTKVLAKEICEVRRGPIEPGDSEVYLNQPLMVPPCPPSRLAGCRIMDIKYTITLVADPAGPGFDLEVPIEVTIGTIPYNNIQASFGMPANGLQPEGKQYNGVPSPTYAIDVFGKVDVHDDDDNEYTKGDMSWAPTYPYYSWGNPDTGSEPGPRSPPDVMVPAQPGGYHHPSNGQPPNRAEPTPVE